MKRFALTGFFALIALVLSGCPSPVDYTNANVDVLVLDESGNPVQDAYVNAYTNYKFENSFGSTTTRVRGTVEGDGKTKANGVATIPLTFAGSYAFDASKDNAYGSTEQRLAVGYNKVTITIKKSEEKLAPLKIKVVDETGNLLSTQTVKISGEFCEPGGKCQTGPSQPMSQNPLETRLTVGWKYNLTFTADGYIDSLLTFTVVEGDNTFTVVMRKKSASVFKSSVILNTVGVGASTGLGFVEASVDGSKGTYNEGGYIKKLGGAGKYAGRTLDVKIVQVVATSAYTKGYQVLLELIDNSNGAQLDRKSAIAGDDLGLVFGQEPSDSELYYEGDSITGLEGKDKYAGKKLSAKLAQVVITGATDQSYKANFEIYDSLGNRIDNVTIGPATDLVEKSGVLATSVFVSAIGVAKTTGLGFVEVSIASPAQEPPVLGTVKVGGVEIGNSENIRGKLASGAKGGALFNADNDAARAVPFYLKLSDTNDGLTFNFEGKQVWYSMRFATEKGSGKDSPHDYRVLVKDGDYINQNQWSLATSGSPSLIAIQMEVEGLGKRGIVVGKGEIYTIDGIFYKIEDIDTRTPSVTVSVDAVAEFRLGNDTGTLLYNTQGDPNDAAYGLMLLRNDGLLADYGKSKNLMRLYTMDSARPVLYSALYATHSDKIGLVLAPQEQKLAGNAKLRFFGTTFSNFPSMAYVYFPKDTDFADVPITRDPSLKSTAADFEVEESGGKKTRILVDTATGEATVSDKPRASATRASSVAPLSIVDSASFAPGQKVTGLAGANEYEGKSMELLVKKIEFEQGRLPLGGENPLLDQYVATLELYQTGSNTPIGTVRFGGNSFFLSDIGVKEGWDNLKPYFIGPTNKGALKSDVKVISVEPGKITLKVSTVAGPPATTQPSTGTPIEVKALNEGADLKNSFTKATDIAESIKVDQIEEDAVKVKRGTTRTNYKVKDKFTIKRTGGGTYTAIIFSIGVNNSGERKVVIQLTT